MDVLIRHNRQLFSINERMSELQPNGAAMLHTMQRHKEILKDYKLEFNKIRNNFTARKDREDLLGSVRKEIEYVQLSAICFFIIHHTFHINEN